MIDCAKQADTGQKPEQHPFRIGKAAGGCRRAHAEKHDDQHAGRAPDIPKPTRRQGGKPDQDRRRGPEFDQVFVRRRPCAVERDNDGEIHRCKIVKQKMPDARECQSQCRRCLEHDQAVILC